MAACRIDTSTDSPISFVPAPVSSQGRPFAVTGALARLDDEDCETPTLLTAFSQYSWISLFVVDCECEVLLVFFDALLRRSTPPAPSLPRLCWGLSICRSGSFRGTRRNWFSSPLAVLPGALAFPAPFPLKLSPPSRRLLLRFLSRSLLSSRAIAELTISSSSSLVVRKCWRADAQWSFLRWPGLYLSQLPLPCALLASAPAFRFFDCWFRTTQDGGCFALRSFNVTCRIKVQTYFC